MDAWADGLNYFLATHPNVHPRVLTQFEPWMALSFTEGSIGGDIERIDLKELERFSTGEPDACSAEGGPRQCDDGRTPRLQRHRDRAEADERRRRAAADQPAHQLLLPLRTADVERRRARSPMAPPPGASSSSIRASTPTRAGCTRRAASIMSTSSPSSVERRGTGSCYRYGPTAGRWRAADHPPLQDRRREAGIAQFHGLDDPSRPDRPRRRMSAGSPSR